VAFAAAGGRRQRGAHLKKVGANLQDSGSRARTTPRRQSNETRAADGRRENPCVSNLPKRTKFEEENRAVLGAPGSVPVEIIDRLIARHPHRRLLIR